MSRLRGLLAAGVGVVLVVSVGVAAVRLSGAAVSDGGSTPARSFNLSGDQSQISVSSPDQHTISVRWRDREDASWSDPVAVYRDDDRVVTQLRMRVGGPTVALTATFTPPDTYYDDEVPIEDLTADDVTVLAVCRDGSCASGPPYPGLATEPAQVTPDGQHALLADLDGPYASWHGDDVEALAPTGLPPGAYGEHQPLLAPDGSLRAVRGEARPGGGCRYTLLTAAPGDADFTPALHHQGKADRRGGCTSNLESFSADYLVVSRSRYDAWFLARDDDRWRVVRRDPSGQVRHPRPGAARLAGAYVRSGYWHWREVLGSSPDGRTLVVQVHRPGEETWGPPKAVARAPAGARCRSIDPMPTYTHGEEDPFYISLTCRTRTGWIYPTAVSDDGRTWHSFVATGSGVRVGRDLIFRGTPTYRWSPGSGLRAVELPVPAGAILTQLGDGSLALSSLVPRATGCAVRVQLAAADAARWSDAVRSTADPLPDELCSLSDVSGERQNLYHHFGRGPTGQRMVRLVWRDGSPVVENGP